MAATFCGWCWRRIWQRKTTCSHCSTARAPVVCSGVKRVWVLNNQTTAVTGVLTTWALRRTSAVSRYSGHATKHDTSSGNPGAGALRDRRHGDEPPMCSFAHGSGRTMSPQRARARVMSSSALSRSIASGTARLVTRTLNRSHCVQAEGITVQHSGSSAVGTADVFIEFTDAAASQWRDISIGWRGVRLVLKLGQRPDSHLQPSELRQKLTLGTFELTNLSTTNAATVLAALPTTLSLSRATVADGDSVTLSPMDSDASAWPATVRVTRGATGPRRPPRQGCGSQTAHRDQHSLGVHASPAWPWQDPERLDAATAVEGIVVRAAESIALYVDTLSNSLPLKITATMVRSGSPNRTWTTSYFANAVVPNKAIFAVENQSGSGEVITAAVALGGRDRIV